MPTMENRVILSLLGVMLAAWVLWDIIQKVRTVKNTHKNKEESWESNSSKGLDFEIPPLLIVGVAPRRLPNKATLGGFPGAGLLSALKNLKLTYGERGIFHKFVTGDTAPQFSVASMKEPGSFDLSVMSTRVYTGVLFFMELRQYQNNATAFEYMLTAARSLANSLEGELVDPMGRTLSPVLLDELRNKAQAFDLDAVEQ